MMNTHELSLTEDPSMTLRNRLARMMRESGYLLGSFPLATTAFVISVTLFSLGMGSLIVWIGIPILTICLYAAGAFAAIERNLVAGATGDEIAPPRYVVASEGSRLKLLTALRDPQRWLELLWTVAHFVMSTFTFTLTVAWWSLALWLPFGPLVSSIIKRFVPDATSGLEALLGVGLFTTVIESLIAAGFLLTLPLAIHGMASMQSNLSRALLGTRAGYEARIEHLQESRSAAHEAEARSLHRLERDIHDGPQQRLVRLQMDLARAQRANDPARVQQLLAEARVQTAETLAELRHLSRGIAPPVLIDRGLTAALEELAARSDVICTVDSDVNETGLTASSTAYFVAAEAIANVNKHSLATSCDLTVTQDRDLLTVTVTDNGIGGASASKGHGLAGLRERLLGVDGTLTVESPVGGPTTIRAEIPCAS